MPNRQYMSKCSNDCTYPVFCKYLHSNHKHHLLSDMPNQNTGISWVFLLCVQLNILWHPADRVHSL